MKYKNKKKLNNSNSKNHIKKPIHYFNKVISNMNKKDKKAYVGNHELGNINGFQ